ncbi:MAG: hypothetical protein AB2L11_03615 [Syntrophobacteraceae bacterium]
MQYSKGPIQYDYFFKAITYTFALFFAQALWISRIENTSFRIDLLLPVMFGVAMEWPLFMSLFWASMWGLAMDTMSGKLWGFHVVSYVVSVCLVNTATEKFEFHNPLYQMGFIGSCAMGQSFVLGLFLVLEPTGSTEIASIWKSLALRAVLMTFVSPLIIYPLWTTRKGAI